ncbi:hypothetical protein Z043_123973, partial [Scleropages formosus]
MQLPILLAAVGPLTLDPRRPDLDQLTEIMKITGTPTQEFIVKLQSQDAKNYIKRLPKVQKKDLHVLFTDVNPDAISLLERMLVLDPEKRVSAAEALALPFFTEFREPEEETEAQPYDHSLDNADLPLEQWKRHTFTEILTFQPSSSLPVHRSTYGSIQHKRGTHHNHHEDRLWGFECKNTFDSSPDCHWTYYVNDFDQEFSFECPSNYVLSGMESYHENKHEDRRWKFYCCRINNFCNSNCQWTPYVNNFDETFDFYVPTQNYLVGTGSYHNNHH